MHASPRSAPPAASGESVEACLERWIPRGSDVALLDVPVNRNAGDLFLLAATDRLLTTLGCRVVYRAGIRDYTLSRAQRRITPGATLVCTGGGNFGDLYPRHQALRQRIIEHFPSHRVVVLPQTVYFRSDRVRRSSARRFLEHPDLHLAVRDERSLQAARRFANDVELLPDLVHAFPPPAEPGAGVRSRPPRASAETLYLLRRDVERDASRADAVRGATASARGARFADWPSLLPGLLPRVGLAAALMPLAPTPISSWLHRWWSAEAARLFALAQGRLRLAQHIVTDRLHGAILGHLAGRPVTLLDNSYGKLTAYYDAWWREDPAVELAPD